MSADVSGLRDALQQWAEEVATQAATQAYDSLNPPVRTGELLQSGFNRSSGTHIEIGFDADQAKFTDEGTAAHPINTPVAFNGDSGFVIIVPDSRSGKIEAFTSKDSGALVIMGMPQVHHPGTTGTFWWTDVIGAEGSCEGLIDIIAEVAQTVTVTA